MRFCCCIIITINYIAILSLINFYYNTFYCREGSGLCSFGFNYLWYWNFRTKKINNFISTISCCTTIINRRTTADYIKYLKCKRLRSVLIIKQLQQRKSQNITSITKLDNAGREGEWVEEISHWRPPSQK